MDDIFTFNEENEFTDKVQKIFTDKVINSMGTQMDFDGNTYFQNDNKVCYKKKILSSTNEIIDFKKTYISQTCSYQKMSVQGFIKKHVNEVKLF